MLYFKNAELARSYHVTLRTVLNWIEATKQGKLSLELHEQGGRSYIVQSKKNATAIEELVESRRKYRNRKSLKLINPNPDFYEYFNKTQIYDIVKCLEIWHELPRQYNYFGEGARNWDKYATRLFNDKSPNTLTGTIDLLRINKSYLEALFNNFKYINVIDIGVGNALPVRELLDHLLKKSQLGRYVGLDISKEMLEVARSNISEWFDGKVNFEGHTLDVAYTRFGDLLLGRDIGEGTRDTMNLILFIGGTPQNFRHPDDAYRVVCDSMRRNDILVCSQKLDSEKSREYFDFYPELPANALLSPNHRLLLDLLNINEAFYDVERGFDKEKSQRYIRIRLKVSISVRFDIQGQAYIITLNKGETILLWRAWQQGALDVASQLDRNDFYMLHSSQTEDQEYILTVSRVKCE